jgi:uncharacterized membrane protein
MKKVFVVFLAFCGVVMVVKGVCNFFPLNFSSILDNNIAFRKMAKLIIGVFLIKYCYNWFYDKDKTQDV